MLCQRPYLLQKQHKNYILYLLLLLYLLIIMSKDMERQSNRVSEQQRCAPRLHWTRSLCTPAPGPQWTRPLCTTAPCLHLDEALLHYCSMPPFGRGPSALLLLALYRTRSPLQELSCSWSRLLQKQQLYMLKDIANGQLSPISIWNSAATSS